MPKLILILMVSAFNLQILAAESSGKTECSNVDIGYRFLPFEGAARARFDSTAGPLINRICFKTIESATRVIFLLSDGDQILNRIEGRSEAYAVHAIATEVGEILSRDQKNFLLNRDPNKQIDSILFSLDAIHRVADEYRYEGRNPKVLDMTWEKLYLALSDSTTSRDNFTLGLTPIEAVIEKLSPQILGSL